MKWQSVLRLSAMLGLAIAASLAAGGRAKAAEEKPISDSFDAKGVRIHYVVQGQGDPVVLIHGLYSSAAINWQMPGIFADLAKNHRVVALDLPGHGGSDKPKDDAAYGAQMAEDVILLMDHLNIPKAHIVGYSLGGIVALRVIADHPDRVLSGVLGGMGWLREGSGLQKIWEDMRPREGGGVPPACVNGIAKLAVTKEALKAISVPMTVLVGDRDPVGELYAVPLQSVRKDWPVVKIKDAGHINCVMKQEFKDELVNWVNRHGSAATTAPAEPKK
jgi:pimeloyl-ACP methyl ester carboxylesterase